MSAGKGDKPRPIVDRTQFEANFEGVFGKSKLQKRVEQEEQDSWEVCEFCGFRMEDPCEWTPPSYCIKALEKQYNENYK